MKGPMSSISAITHQLSNKPRNVEDYVSLIVHHVTQTLLKKSQASNQEVDDAIRAEVMAVIRSGHAGEDAESIVELERRVLHRLDLSNANSSMRDINETTKGTTMDEWALLAKYAALEEQEEELQKTKDARLKAQEARTQYLEHQAELKRQKMMEKKEKKEEWSRVQADVSKWKADEQSKKVAKRNAADAIKRDREAQLEGYQHQRLVATLLRHASEAHALEVLKKESQASLQAEKAARDVARREMEIIFEKNRAAKAAQLEAKRMEQEEDRRYMTLYAEMLDKQDAQRKEQLQKIQNAQDTQAKLVVLPTSDRRWVVEGVIEQQAASREILESKRELERKRKEAKSAEEFKRDVANQLKDKAALEARAKEERLKDKAALEAISKQVKQEQRQRAMSLTAAKQQQRKDLNDQIVARRMARQSKRAMNAIERKLNARRLQQAAVALQKSF